MQRKSLEERTNGLKIILNKVQVLFLFFFWFKLKVKIGWKYFTP